MSKEELLIEYRMINDYLKATYKSEKDCTKRLEILKEIFRNNEIYSYELYKINKLRGQE